MSETCDPQIPSSFPRRVLVATLGLAPQVLTETLYCLAKTHDERFVPTEIHIITTIEGAHHARLTLLAPTEAMLLALERDHQIAGISDALKEDNIHIISSKSGTALDDIDSKEDNARAADLITGLVRDIASDEESAMHVSIAGGRKTMGFLLGYALSLFGRPQDRLSHVLVSEPFQAHPQFFFPPRVPMVLRDRDKRPVSTADANLILADIPVVRLRERMPKELLSGSATYSQTVQQAQQLFEAPEMTVDHKNHTLTCHNIVVALPPQTFALAAWMARRTITMPREKAPLRWDDDAWGGYLKEYALVPGVAAETLAKLHQRYLSKDKSAEELDSRKSFFQEHLSRLKKALKQQLGALAPQYVPETIGKHGNSSTRFPLQAGAIRFV